MKKLMILAALGTAALFTACSDDSSSSPSGNSTQLDGKTVVSCDKVTTIMGISSHYCYAIAADDANVEAFKAKCAPISELDDTQYTVGAGCAESMNACDTPEGQVEYMYDEASSHFTCEELGGGHSL